MARRCGRGSFRALGQAVQVFAADAVAFTALRLDQPAQRCATGAVAGTHPAGRFQVLAVLDDQELDSSGSTGAIYWGGPVRAAWDHAGQPAGRGYLEMTGYKSRCACERRQRLHEGSGPKEDGSPPLRPCRPPASGPARR